LHFANLPDGLSDLPDGLFCHWRVKPLLQKYSDFPKTQISCISMPSRPTEGRFENVTNAGRDAVDAAALARNVMAGRVERSVSF
jgi:hypothetical protein